MLSGLKKLFSKENKRSQKIKDVLILGALALALVFVVWQTFYKEDAKLVSTITQSENEAKLCGILSKIDGVGEAEVMIYEENGVKSVVVVCEGANNLSVVLDVREAVCAALGTEATAVKIYQLKE